MGYRGKVADQNRARDLRAQAWTLQQIADELGVAKSSVSLWVRDVIFEPKPRQRPAFRNPSSLHLAKLAEIDAMNELGVQRVGVLSDEAFLAAGIALFAGEGAKGNGRVKFANSDPMMVSFFCRWLRTFFAVDEARLRVTVYLHRGLDMDAAQQHWSEVTSVPLAQFRKGHRPVPDPSIRVTKHEFGCCYFMLSCSRTHREVMGLVRALLSSEAIPG